MAYQFYFETGRVWQDSMTLVQKVYSLTSEFPEQEQFGLTSQMRRAAVSIASNLAEGSVRKSFKEQARFTEIAFGSLMEVHCQLTIAQQLSYLQEENKIELHNEISIIARQLNALRDTQESRAGEPEVAYETLQSCVSSNPPNLSRNGGILPSSYYQHETAIIDPGATIGINTKIWHFSHIMSGAVIGENCNIGQNIFIANGVILGNNVKVQNNVSIYEGVTCEEDVFLGPSMVFTNVINPRSAVNRKGEYLKTHVGKGATIGANATIIGGNNIGKYAFIGAGAVVTKNIPDYAMVVGNPAHQIGWMSEYGEKLEFDKNGKAVCKGSEVRYQLQNEQVTKSPHHPVTISPEI